MKYFFSGSLAARMLWILFFGLTLSHLLSILVFTSEKMEVSMVSSKAGVLARMAGLIRLLGNTPQSVHDQILQVLYQSGVHFEVVSAGTAVASAQQENQEPLRHALERAIADPKLRVVAFVVQDPDWNHPYGTLHRLLFWIEVRIIQMMHSEVIDREWHILVQFSNGLFYAITSRPADNHVPLFRHTTISVLIMSGAIFVFVLYMVQQMTRHWQRIVRGAERFGQDLYAPPLPEEGATEIVQAAQVFNRMNRRIRGFVEERLQMIAAISHDLRTPLTKLRLLIEFIRDEEGRQRMLAILTEMEGYLFATLSFARDAVEIEPKQSMNISGLLTSICTDLVDTGHPVFCDEIPKYPYFCRPLAMKRALTNLIENALKHSQPQVGGVENVLVSMTVGQDYIFMDIQDPGPGIPESEWQNVLKPFYRLTHLENSCASGAGLGLAITASVVHDHGGEIRFSHLPEGRFMTRVALPLDRS
ncbi:MAG: ATP-binding protein [Magnetococcus sp. DMHC-6]